MNNINMIMAQFCRYLKESDKRIMAVLFVFIFILFIPYFSENRWRLVMDEAIFIFQGYQIADGNIFYRDTLMDKPPGLPYTFALFFYIFGKHVFVARILTAIIAATTSIVVFKVGEKIYSRTTGFFSAAFYGFISAHPAIGAIGWSLPETYMNLFVALGFLYFVNYIQMEDRKVLNLLLSGFFIGVSFLMKQPGLMTLFPIAAIILLQHGLKKKLKRKILHILIISLGMFLALLPAALYFWYYGVLDELLRWSITVWWEMDRSPSVYDKVMKFYWVSLRLAFFSSLFCVGFFLAAMRIVHVYGKKPFRFIKNIYSNFHKRLWDFFIMLWLGFFLIFIARAPDMYSHYLLQFVLPATFFAGKASDEIYHSFKSKQNIFRDSNIFETAVIIIIIFLAVMNFGDYVDKPILTVREPNREIADYIKAHTNESDMIYTFAGPQIYIYSERKPASKYFILMMGYSPLDYIPKEIQKDIEKNRPKYIIPNSIYTRPRYNQTLTYIYQHYHLEITINNMDLYRINE